MIPEHKGQTLMLVMILMLTLILSYCAVPDKSTDTPRKNKIQARWILRPYLANLKIRGSENVSPAKLETAVKEKAAPVTKNPEPLPEPITETITRPEPEPELKNKIAQKAAPDASAFILMNNPKYASHTKPIVKFTHKKHMDEYSKSCGDCHHDNNGKPLDLKPGDPVDGCITCHKETKKKKGVKLDPLEKIKTYHNEALHANCIDCHKALNIEKGDPKGMTPAPVTCRGCHQ